MKHNHFKVKGLMVLIIAICMLVSPLTGGGTAQALGPINSWTRSSQDATSNGNTLGVSYTNGMFIACGDYERIGTSINGKEWTNKFSGPSDIGFKAVAYNESGTYMAVCESGKVAVSPDLTQWEFKDTLNVDDTQNTSDFTGVAYGNNMFIAVTIDGEIYKSDSAGNTCTLELSDSGKAFFGVTYVTYLNKFFAYGNGSVLLSSSDGETWSQVASTGSAIAFRSMAFRSDGANSIIVATGAAGQIRTSTDGDTWTDSTSGTGAHLNSVTYGNNGLTGMFLAIGSSGGAVLSYDGVNWSTAPGVGVNTTQVAYGNNTFVACNPNGDFYNSPRTYFSSFNICEITGTVTDSSGGTGIQGATVSAIIGSETASCIADANGDYTVNDAPVGNITVIASKAGYRSGVQNLTVTAGTVINNLDFSLEADSTAPTLLSPNNNTTGVSTIDPIVLQFSEDIKIDAAIGTELKNGDLSLSVLSGAGFKLGKTSGGNEAGALLKSASYDQALNTLKLTTNGLEANADYYLAIDGIYDMAGIALDPISLHFTTGGYSQITDSTIAGISAPVTDMARVTTPPGSGLTGSLAQWTSGDITWYNGGQASSGATIQNAVYEAHFTLTPKSGYAFTGISPTGFFDGCISALDAASITYQTNGTNTLALDVIVTYPATKNSSLPPVVDSARVVKTAVVQKSVDFVISNGQTLTGTWKVYGNNSTTSALTMVIPTYNDGTKILTLTSTGSNIPSATYYITHAESGKAESTRLKLLVVEAPEASPTLSCDLVYGKVTITPNADGTTYHVYFDSATSEAKHVDVDYAKKIEIKQSNASSPVQATVEISGTNQPAGIPIEISLKGVNIDTAAGQGGMLSPAVSLINNANVNVTLIGANTLKGDGSHAGLEVPAGSSVKINEIGGASLTATGSANAAGIGGGYGTCGEITINGGNINANGGNFAAGIGSYGDNGTVTINGGHVNATGGLYAAGIGGGSEGNGGKIDITGGTVVAKGNGASAQFGAGIGGGGFQTAGKGAGGTITIGGNADVTAIGGRAVSYGTVLGGSGIGGGFGGSGYGAADNGTLTITGTPKIKAAAATTGQAITASISSSTIGVLRADFALEVPQGTELCTNTGASLSPGAISVSPSMSYQSVAFAVPGNGTYWLKTGGIYQMHNTSGSYSSDFTISAPGLTPFSGVKNENIPAKVVNIVPGDAAVDVSATIGTIAITFDEDINLSGNSGSELADGPLTWSSLSSTLPFFKFGTASGQNDAAGLISGASYSRATNTLTLEVGTMATNTTYYLAIAGITDIPGNGAIYAEKSFTIAAQILTKIGKTVTIGTAIPATDSVMADGANAAPAGANNPAVAWSTDGVSYSAASGSYASATTYRTKYVYPAQDGYEFDLAVATADITGSGIGTGKGTVTSATVSQTARANDTLTVVVTWPATALNQSAAPTVGSAAVTKTAVTQGTVSFTLTNSPALTGTWKVYTGATGTTEPVGITVSAIGSTLTLEHASDVPAGTYYIAVTESGKTESARLALIVEAYVPPAPTQSATPTVGSATVTKTAATQGAVSFTMTNNPALTGTWKIYIGATGTTAPVGITVSAIGSTLTLEHASDVPAGTYYIAVTESGKTESARLSLTVEDYDEPVPSTQSATPTVASATVAKTSAVQNAVHFTLTNSPTLTGTWGVYTGVTGMGTPAGIAVSVNGLTLTLEHASDVPAGTYYVAVTESGKTESTRRALTVADYVAPPAPPAPSNGGGGGSGGGGTGIQSQRSSIITLDTKTDLSGKAVTAAVVESQITDAVKQAIEDAAKKGQGNAAEVEIKVNVPADVKTVEISVQKAAAQALAASNADTLTVSTPIAEITFDSKSIDTISGEAAEDVKITVAEVGSETLSTEIKQVVGDRPVFSFSVVSGNRNISQFGGNVTVSVPYTPQPGEDNNAIVIYYINAEGTPETVSNCVYDPAMGRISFTTSHFSQYAVGYNKVSFKDVRDSAWYSKAVSFIAARNITTGTGDGRFNPDGKLTRAQFIVMVMRSYGIEADASPADNFTDAGNTYYTNYLAAAKRLGISTGVGGNRFAPNKEISRQEMGTLLYNMLKLIDRLPSEKDGKSLAEFGDTNDMASWAKDAMQSLVNAGIITGSGGRLLPEASSNRAQMAQILYNLSF